MLDARTMLRMIAVLAMTLTVAACGDGGGGGNDNDTDDFPVTPGVLTGRLDDGGEIRLQVGSIEAVQFDCGGDQIQETFSPPRPVDATGNFEVDFTDGGRRFEVRGIFTGQNHVDGTVNDQLNECDSGFSVDRNGPTPTAPITPTATGPATPTETPPGTVTPTGEPPTTTPTPTPTGPTPTATGPTPTNLTPTVTRTPTPNPSSSCPVGVEVIGTAGAAEVLDTGWTGLAHDQTVIQDGKITFSLDCDGTCTACDVGGPIQNVKAGAGDIDAHRCSGDTSIACDDDDGCTGKGKCVFYFGSPLPLSAGGVSTCVTNQVNGNVSGTSNLDTGQFATTINLTSRVYNAIELAVPCPVCVGDATVNDGTQGGTCSDGPRKNLACDGNGRSAKFQSFGTTSFDCPPNNGALITALSIALDGSSGTETLTLTSGSPNCVSVSAAGKKCFCPNESQETRPSACIDDTSTPENGLLCAPDSPTQGHCADGPVDPHCTIESFRGCLQDSDCPAAGDNCIASQRLCYLDNGVVGGSVSAFGMADIPDANGEADPTFAALFCVGRTNAAVNAAAGLPGLGRIELPLHSKLIRPPSP